MMLADNPDSAGNFPEDSNDVAAIIPPEYSIDRIYLTELPIYEARKRVMDGINSGAGFLNYMGHGLLDRLAHENMFSSSNIGALNNGEKLPVMSFMACLTGRFEYPGYDSIGELLVLKPAGGAAAVWAATGMSLNEDAKILLETFVKKVYIQDEKTLGHAILDAFETYKTIKGRTFILDIHNLLGEPVLQMKP